MIFRRLIETSESLNPTSRAYRRTVAASETTSRVNCPTAAQRGRDNNADRMRCYQRERER